MEERDYPELVEVRPGVSQELELVCGKCGRKDVYDVGMILVPEPDVKKSSQHIGFQGYFRCNGCGSAGPWDIPDFSKIQELVTHRHDPRYADRIYVGAALGLSDGTMWQTNAMAEEHLLKQLEENPASADLLANLGNLLRNCTFLERAREYYEKALVLDPWQLEARYYLFWFSLRDNRIAHAAVHASLLVGAFLEGCEARIPPLTQGLAYSTVKNLRNGPQELRKRILEAIHQSRADDFIPMGPGEFFAELFTAEGDEQKILNHFTECLLESEVISFSEEEDWELETGDGEEDEENKIDLCSSLEHLVNAKCLDPYKLKIVLPEAGASPAKSRNHILLTDGSVTAEWNVPSLRAMFRGNKPAPDTSVFGAEIPAVYNQCLEDMDRNLLAYAERFGDPTDQELEGIYSVLRRKPDGRSQGAVHDCLWQAAALLLGKRELSVAQYEYIMGSLESTARHEAEDRVSRNYMKYVRETLY